VERERQRGETKRIDANPASLTVGVILGGFGRLIL
jgi:hypothetical protein